MRLQQFFRRIYFAFMQSKKAINRQNIVVLDGWVDGWVDVWVCGWMGGCAGGLVDGYYSHFKDC